MDMALEIVVYNLKILLLFKVDVVQWDVLSGAFMRFRVLRDGRFDSGLGWFFIFCFYHF